MPSPPRCNGGSSASLSSSSTLHRSNKRHARRLRPDAVRACSARACLRVRAGPARPAVPGACDHAKTLLKRLSLCSVHYVECCGGKRCERVP